VLATLALQMPVLEKGAIYDDYVPIIILLIGLMRSWM